MKKEELIKARNKQIELDKIELMKDAKSFIKQWKKWYIEHGETYINVANKSDEFKLLVVEMLEKEGYECSLYFELIIGKQISTHIKIEL